MRTRTVLGLSAGILLLANPWSPSAKAADDSKVNESVVKIFATIRHADPFRPWTKGDPAEAAGSGVVVAGKRVLTNAHMVNNASQIYIQPDKSSEKLIATVVARAPGIDLAVLKLDDESFFDTHPPLPMNTRLPDLKQPVFAYGFPTGGSAMSITRGIVSRVEYVEYYFKTEGLRIQIDAAVNPGNSGGPVTVDGQMIGLVFSGLREADNIGYVVPSEEIKLFLEDIQDGRYDGKPVLEVDVQHMENPTLRARFKLPRTTTGVLVRKVHGHDASYPLRPGDIIARIGDHVIDNSGIARIEGDRRIAYACLVQRLARDGRLPLAIVRDGRAIALDLPVRPASPQLFSSSNERPFSYFIFGPLAFTEATEDYILYMAMMYAGAKKEETSNPRVLEMLYSANPVYARYGDRPAFPGERIVVVPHPMFACPIGKGYDDPYGNAVDAVNGVRVRNLAHMVQVVRDATGEYIEFTFHGQATNALVFTRKEALDITAAVLADNGIREQFSPDIAAIWNKKK